MTQALVGGIWPEWTQADRLRKAREISGLQQRDLAAAMGASLRTVQRYEAGIGTPKRPVVIAWALATGVAFEFLWCAIRDLNPEPADSGLALVKRTRKHLTLVTA